MRTVKLSVLALAITMLGTTGRAQAAVTVDRESTIGKQAAMFFSVSKTVQCTSGPSTAFAFGFITGAASVSRSTGLPVTRTNGVTVDVFGFSNGCTETPSNGSGGFADGFFTPGPQLALATLNGSGTIQDFGSGATLPFSVHLTVSGTGPTSSSGATTETHTFNGPGGPFTITIQRSANNNRSGTVTGTFTLGGVVFDLAGTSATLVANSNATITVTKP